MRRQFIFLDKLEKLNLRKDSSLLLALTFQQKGYQTFLIFDEDLYWSSSSKAIKCYPFSGVIRSDFYLENIQVGHPQWIELNSSDVVHMRLDPPVDGRYLRALWILELLKSQQGVHVVNDPEGLLTHNEKIIAYQKKDSIPSWIGMSPEAGYRFIADLPPYYTDVILKPLDLYSGIEVEKLSRSTPQIMDKLKAKAHKLSGYFVIQPFIKDVYQGEIRVITMKGELVGSILKKPKTGEFISNIAAGASFESVELSPTLLSKTLSMARELRDKGLDWVAFDVLGGVIQEANITCPGLLVEASHVSKENLALKLISLMEGPESDR